MAPPSQAQAQGLASHRKPEDTAPGAVDLGAAGAGQPPDSESESAEVAAELAVTVTRNSALRLEAPADLATG